MAEAGASLRDICRLSNAASRIKQLTRAEATRIVKARRLCQRNPSRDPEYVGAFTLGHEPKKAGYVDGDTAAVQSPHVRHPHLDRDYEVWVFGMVDPRLGDTWNYVTGPLAKSEAITEAKKLARL